MCMPPFKTSAAAQTHEQVALKQKQKQKQTVAELESDVPLSLPLNSDDEFLKIGDQEEGLDMGNPSPRSVLKTKTSTASDDGSSSALQPLPSPTPMADSMQTWLDPSSDSSSSSSSSDDDSYSQKPVMAWKRKPPGQGNGGKSKRAGFAASLRHLQPKTEGNHGEGIFSAGSPLSPFHCQNHLHPLSDLLEACFFCNSPFRPGKDIYMYRGDRAFCSVECRYEQIIIDERNEQCPTSSKK